MLRGQAKTDYQRRYMREYRLKKQDVRPSVRPQQMYMGGVPINMDVPELDADGNPIYDD